jgi:BirA family transcriptional regulator, biotin operon repressor / biotin---[acetyl-CoA-carboxylase] ligase
VTWVAETGSTNADLVVRARAGAGHGAVLVADHQTAGRGRLGRTWQAPPGSALLCSILLRPEPSAVVHGAVWAVALAAQSAVAALTGVTPELKWPNDLMVGERKLAGVLAEGVIDPEDPLTLSGVVVGIGLNVRWAERPAPHLDDGVAARAITVEELGGHSVDRRALLGRLLADLAPLLDRWARHPEELHARYRAHLDTLGRRVRVELGDRELSGVAVDVTPDGLAIRLADGTEEVVLAGDVVHLRPV